MAAMGAQAASQIESNRMMTETMQRGMQGVEDFAARRQLAAARAQLGALNIEDESYGQKLSELVMDNPLAFTNRKTAAVANMAFKQAGEDFRNKRDNEMRMAMQAQEFSNSRTLASMSQANQMTMANLGRSAEIQAKVYARESDILSQEMESVLKQMAETDSPEARKLLGKQLQGIKAKMGQLSTNLEARTSFPELDPYSSIDTTPSPLPTESPAQNVAPMGSAGNGIPLPLAAEGRDDYYNPLIMGLGDGGAYGAPPVVQAAPVPEFTSEDGLPPAPAAAAPAATAAVPAAAAAPAATPTGRPSYGLSLEEEQQLNTLIAEESNKKDQDKKRDTMSGAEFQDQQNFTEDLVTNDPEVGKLMSEVSTLTNKSKALETLISSNKLVPNAEQNAQFLATQSDLTQKANELNQLRAAKRLEIRNAGGAAQYQIKKAKQEQERLDAAVKAQKDPATAEANARLASAMAGTSAAPAAGAGAAVPPPPLNEMAKGFAKIETPRKIAEANIVPETNKQWTNAKNQVVDAVGGMDQLIQIADGVFQGNVLEVDIPMDKLRLQDAITKAILKKVPGGLEKSVKGFVQKSERSGMESVYPMEIISALVDDVIRARKEGVASAAAAALRPSPVSADGKTGTLSKP